MTRTQPNHPSRLRSTSSDPIDLSHQRETPRPGFTSTISSDPCRPKSAFEHSAEYIQGYNDAFIAIGNASAASNSPFPSPTAHSLVQTRRKSRSHTSQSPSTSEDGSSGTSISYPSSLDSSSILTSSHGISDEVQYEGRIVQVYHRPTRSSGFPPVYGESSTPSASVYPRHTGVCGILPTVVTQNSQSGLPICRIHGQRYFPNFASPHSYPIHRPTTSASDSYQPSSSNSHNNFRAQIPPSSKLRHDASVPTLAARRSAAALSSASNNTNITQRDSLQQGLQPLYQPDLHLSRGYGYDWPPPSQTSAPFASTTSWGGFGSGNGYANQAERSIYPASGRNIYHGGAHAGGDVPEWRLDLQGYGQTRRGFNGYGLGNGEVWGPQYGFGY
ncbi:hypothetical protein BKA61DRAFT_317455 [Leptodontidium sp. MPI-SDFR-AT-0119]|nr:hypothetical protein BKA61DRAFT_317455 [Leptodontidium sp. MPI-SDFR-AT-0119]